MVIRRFFSYKTDGFLLLLALSELYTPDQWEIDKDSVTLDKLIGQGHFGHVYQGILKLSDGTYKTCAVKVNRIKFSLINNDFYSS